MHLAMCKLLCANCYVQTAMCKLLCAPLRLCKLGSMQTCSCSVSTKALVERIISSARVSSSSMFFHFGFGDMGVGPRVGGMWQGPGVSWQGVGACGRVWGHVVGGHDLICMDGEHAVIWSPPRVVGCGDMWQTGVGTCTQNVWWQGVGACGRGLDTSTPRALVECSSYVH